MVADTKVRIIGNSTNQVTLTLSQITDQAVANDLSEDLDAKNSTTLPRASSHSLAKASPVLSTLPDGNLRGDIQQYTIKKGDTISAVAERHGITTDTVLQSNGIDDPFAIKPDQKLLILPVSGALHPVTKSDTIDSIARKYKANSEQIMAINDIEPSALTEGQKLIVPGAQFSVKVNERAGATTARFIKPYGRGMFILPTRGRARNGYHWWAVDIPGAYGQPIWATAGGRVAVATRGCPPNYSVYNGPCAIGGNLVVINHGNGFETHYAHNASVYVRPGQYVQKGQVIASMGCSGITRGGTNGRCAVHLHFEIRLNGVRYNPFRFL